MPRLMLSVLALGATVSAMGAPLPSLQELENRARSSLAMRTLDAELEMAQRRSQADLTSAAPRLYGAGGLSNGDEVLDPTRSRAYSSMTSEVGLRLPLLGSRAQILAANQRVTGSLQQREAQVELARRDIIRRLRVAYADYWSAQQASLLSRTLLENEPAMMQILKLRTGAGLLLDSDRRQLLTGFEVARNDLTRAQLGEQQALQQLRLLVADDLVASPASFPPLQQLCGVGSADGFDVDQDPEILALNAQLELVAPLASAERWRGMTSELRLGYQLAGESYGARTGGSAVVGWSFEMPLNYGAQRGRITSAADAETNYLDLQRDLRRAELVSQYRSLSAKESAVRQSLRLASAQLQAADQAVHERELRAARLAGDVTQQLLYSKFARYSVARAQIDAHRNELLWFADWARFEPLSCGAASSPSAIEPLPTPLPTPMLMKVSVAVAAPLSSQHATEPAGRSVYLWTSGPWLAGTAHDVGSALSRLKASGVSSLMVSLDADQIAQQATDDSALRALARRASAAGIRIELLLGEPSWILPQHRARLLQIVQRLHNAPFSALHLDLEPNMLDDSAAGTARLLPELVQTLRAVKAISPWPLGCSLHPRYLNVVTNGKALGEQLAALQVTTTLMVYVANPQRVVDIAQPIIARYPRLQFRVALSLESTLGRDESLFSFPEAERAARIARVEQALSDTNFHGVSLQPSLPWMAQWLVQR